MEQLLFGLIGWILNVLLWVKKSLEQKCCLCFEDLNKKYLDKKANFKANWGWFLRFKERRSYHSIKKFDNVEINKTLVTTIKELEMDLEEGNFIDLFEKDKQLLMNEDLTELMKEPKNKKVIKREPHHFSLKKIQEAFAFIEKGLHIFKNMMHGWHEAFAPYVILEENNKNTVQGILDQFLIKKLSNNYIQNQLLILAIHFHLHLQCK